MPPAARITDMHVCPMVTGVVPHVGGPILPPCAPTVLIGYLPAARVSDMATCVGPPDVILMGSPTVLINNLMAARIGDPTAHGGVIMLGCFTVIIGEAGAPSPSAPSAPPLVQKIEPTRKPGDAGFDEKKMYSIFSKSKTAKNLEAKAIEKGFKYAGDVADPKSGAYTDVKAKEIRINKNQTPEQADLAYAYELQNANNGANYKKIFDDARSGKIKNAKEFSAKIMGFEAEALETEANAAIEMCVKDPQQADVISIVKTTPDEAERKKKILEWADSKGQIKGMKPSAYYENMYTKDYAAPK
jgi:uncharacterized Zn-binding protein involved in type VI secretion